MVQFFFGSVEQPHTTADHFNTYWILLGRSKQDPRVLFWIFQDVDGYVFCFSSSCFVSTNGYIIGGLGWWFGFLGSPYERDCYSGPFTIVDCGFFSGTSV